MFKKKMGGKKRYTDDSLNCTIPQEGHLFAFVFILFSVHWIATEKCWSEVTCVLIQHLFVEVRSEMEGQRSGLLTLA